MRGISGNKEKFRGKMEPVKHSILYLLLFMSMISTSTWILSEAKDNVRTYQPYDVLHSRRMLLQAGEESKIIETEPNHPNGLDEGNLATTENKGEIAQSEMKQEVFEKANDDALETEKKEEEEKENEKEKEDVRTSLVEESISEILVNKSVKGEDEMFLLENTLETVGVKEPKSEGNDGETIDKKILTKGPNDTNEEPKNKEKSKDEAFDVEMEVSLGLDPETKEKEKGETLSLNSVVESESTNVMEAQTGEARKETELDQRDEETKVRETKKKKKKNKTTKTVKNVEKPSTTVIENSNTDEWIESNATPVKELNSEATMEDDLNIKETVKEQDKEIVEIEKPTSTQDKLSSNKIEGSNVEVEVKASTKGKETQKEELNTLTKEKDAEEPKSVGNDGDVEDDDDEYGDFMQDFIDLPSKLQDTALKVVDHLSPNIYKLTDKSKTYFNKANQQITESFSPLVGKQVAPFFGTLISFSLLLVPLAIVGLLFDHIRAVLSLQKILLFINIYLSAYFATLLFATSIIGEPMMFFYKSSARGYIHLQLFQAFGYTVYLILQTFDMVYSLSLSLETLLVKVTVVLQWFVAFTIGFHYYVTIFHRAMASKGPHTSWKIYGVYSLAFLVLCLFARIQRTKKGYSQVGNIDTDKRS